MHPWLSRLAADLNALPAGALWLGFSAGLDSSVLLHALAALPQARARGLTALHVQHGLHPDADQWLQQAQISAAALGVPLQSCTVTVDRASGCGLEAAARAARRAAFARWLPRPAILALAQHQDDQVETVLLRLLHGAGSEGLAAMRSLHPLQGDDDACLLWRPLLQVPRAALLAYAQQQGLQWIEDPANADPQHARNRLRHSVLPALRAAFPEADGAIAAAARRLRAESDVLDARARILLHQALHSAGTLQLGVLHGLEPALMRRVFGLWLDRLGLPRPPPGIWSQLQPALLDARRDSQAELAWHGARVRRHRETLHADTGRDPAPWSPLHWDGLHALSLPAGLGTLQFTPGLRQPAQFVLRPRRGGERLQLRGQHRALKKLLQQTDLPPWQRARLPLLLDAAGTLCAVPGHWHSDAFAHWLAEQGTMLQHRHD